MILQTVHEHFKWQIVPIIILYTFEFVVWLKFLDSIFGKKFTTFSHLIIEMFNNKCCNLYLFINCGWCTQECRSLVYLGVCYQLWVCFDKPINRYNVEMTLVHLSWWIWSNRCFDWETGKATMAMQSWTTWHGSY